MHQLTVIASDLGEPIPKSGQMTLQILVDDANDSPPRCAVPATVVHVQEYWADNALLTCVHAIDDDADDNSRLTYGKRIVIETLQRRYLQPGHKAMPTCRSELRRTLAVYGCAMQACSTMKLPPLTTFLSK